MKSDLQRLKPMYLRNWSLRSGTRWTPQCPSAGQCGVAALLAALCLALAGCAYTCHTYLPFTEPVATDGWVVKGDIDRYRPADWNPGPGSWTHWSAEDGDRYLLKMRPVALDTTYWERGEVELRNVFVTAGGVRQRIEWGEVVDRAEEAASRQAPLRRTCELKHGKVRFESVFFHIHTPVPDTLWIDYELVLKDPGAHVPRQLWRLRSPAVIEKHRRWHIVDMAES